MNSIDKAIKVVSEFYDFDELKNALRQRIIEEYEAINSYEKMTTMVKDPKIRKIIQDIANEEKAHVGELEEILYNISPSELKEVEKGKRENEG